MTTQAQTTPTDRHARSRRRAAALSFSALLAALACNTTLPGDTEGSSDTQASGETSESGGSGESGGFMPCSAANACPDGQFCFNGLCALGCNANGDCASDQYCDTEGDRLCHNKSVPTCPDTPCPEGQECVNGFCSAGKAASCEPMPNGEDGCDKDSLCIEDLDMEGSYACYAFPACAADGTCPKGTQGAVCNDGLIPSKNKICLIGLCTDAAAHCPADWFCFKYAGEVLGACSSGGPGEPCNDGGECISGNCMIILPGQPGFCG